MLVYRIEKDGVGPYYWKCKKTNKKVKLEVDDLPEINCASTHPLPMCDGIVFSPGMPYKDYNYAFRSLEALDYWFCEGWREELALYGFELAVYRLHSPEEVLHGNKQLAFNKYNVVSVEYRSLYEPLSPSN